MTDIIFCRSHCYPVCCRASQLGFLYGLRSDDLRYCGMCKIDFIDIDFKRPDTEKHRAAVLQFAPKYATVLDVMEGHQLVHALDMARVFSKSGVLPILIPKIQCIHEIPKQYILGYSIPTTYGYTALSTSAFAGRRLHLLGGTPKQQAEYYRHFIGLGCEIVSLDCNSVAKAAGHGTVWRDRYRREWYNDGLHKAYVKTLMLSLENVWNFWQEILADPTRGQLEMDVI